MHHAMVERKKPRIIEPYVEPSAIEQLSQTMEGRIKVAKLNIDENQEIATRYGVKSIPSLILFKAGKEIARTIGAAPKEKISKIHRRISFNGLNI